MSRRLILLSFADTRYRVALERLKGYTQNFSFDERHFLTERDLPKEYIRKLKPWLYRRGYGYWAWKPYVVRRQLEQMNDGDILFYSDGGLYWNDRPAAIKRFNEYIEALETQCDILVFEERYIESEWTKGDLFEVLGLYDNKAITETNQIVSGLFGVRKTNNVMSLVRRWENLNIITKELVTDKHSTIRPDYPNFIEHRHDQSILSLLVKQVPHILMSNSEWSTPDGDWEKLASFPLQGRRMKELGRPWKVVLMNKLLHPWRTLLYHYFTKCRGYHFAIKSYPW